MFLDNIPRKLRKPTKITARVHVCAFLKAISIIHCELHTSMLSCDRFFPGPVFVAMLYL